MKTKRTDIVLLSLTILLPGCKDKNEDNDITLSSTSTSDSAEISQLSAEEYYDKYSEEVKDVVSAEDYEEVYTEAEAANLFNDRGFKQYPVTYDYSISGEYVGETEVSDNSDKIHPIYQTYYITENEDTWIVYLIGDAMCADPISYNVESEGGATLMYLRRRNF